jgi:HAD superfamily hydrolase (TIGR01549 family)
MIKTVFLDFYGTMGRFVPEAASIQTRACALEGITVSLDSLAQAYPTADRYMAEENARIPVAARPESEQRAFFAEYERRLLKAAGLPVTVEKAGRVWDRVTETSREFDLYDDVLLTLNELRKAGLKTGIISNMPSDRLANEIDRLGLRDLIDVSTTSGEAGVTKPHPAIFRAALAKAGVEPGEALHVGDDYEGDVVGAQNAQMHALWLVRQVSGDTHNNCPAITSLRKVLPYLSSNGHLAPPRSGM